MSDTTPTIPGDYDYGPGAPDIDAAIILLQDMRRAPDIDAIRDAVSLLCYSHREKLKAHESGYGAGRDMLTLILEDAAPLRVLRTELGMDE